MQIIMEICKIIGFSSILRLFIIRTFGFFIIFAVFIFVLQAKLSVGTKITL